MIPYALCACTIRVSFLLPAAYSFTAPYTWIYNRKFLLHLASLLLVIFPAGGLPDGTAKSFGTLGSMLLPLSSPLSLVAGNTTCTASCETHFFHGERTPSQPPLACACTSQCMCESPSSLADGGIPIRISSQLSQRRLPFRRRLPSFLQ